jgi:hypothetical protein
MRPNEQATGQALRARRGAALPLTLFMIVVLTTLSAGAFTMIGSERRVADDQRGQLDAYVIARRGIEQYVGNRAALGFTSTPPAAFESTTVAIPGGYAQVVLRQVRPPVGTTVHGLYLLQSRGRTTRGGALDGIVTAERTVAEYVRYQFASLEVKSAWTAMGGLVKNGGTGTLSGSDGCGAAPAVAGVAVPNTPNYTQSGGTSVPAGSPPVLDMGTATQTVAGVPLDWNGIVNGGALQADIEYPGGSWPTTANWSDVNFWPVIRVNGDFSLPADGRGTLVVTGNLTMSGSVSWRGIILVGGALTSNGNNTVSGAVISGLNTKLGMAVPVSDVGNGTKTFRYNSCDVASASNGLTGLVPYKNASVDNIPSP